MNRPRVMLPVKKRLLLAPVRRFSITKPAPVKAQHSLLEVGSYYLGKGIILFTMFYCGMNWWHYREMRLKDEEENKDE
jgi:hypothetical protein